jgi:TRAP-type C4-dicarboxylate transport system permease small subunit
MRNPMFVAPMADGTTLDLKGGWDNLMSKLPASFNSILDLTTLVAVIIMVGAFAMWGWEKRKGQGGGQGSSKLLWTGFAAMMLAIPKVVFPAVLYVVDIIGNIVKSILESLS